MAALRGSRPLEEWGQRGVELNGARGWYGLPVNAAPGVAACPSRRRQRHGRAQYVALNWYTSLVHCLAARRVTI